MNWRFLDTLTENDLDVEGLTVSEVDGLFPDFSNQPRWRILLIHQIPTNLLEVMLA